MSLPFDLYCMCGLKWLICIRDKILHQKFLTLDQDVFTLDQHIFTLNQDVFTLDQHVLTLNPN